MCIDVIARFSLTRGIALLRVLCYRLEKEHSVSHLLNSICGRSP